MSDPQRLLSAESGSDELLRSALGAADDDQPSADAFAQLTSQLAAALPAGALTSAASTVARHAASNAPSNATSHVASTAADTARLFSAKWILGALVVGGIAGASIHAAVVPGVQPLAHEAAAPSTSVAPAKGVAPPETIPTVAVSALPAVSAVNAPPSVGQRPAASSSAAAASAPLEPELLDRAHDALLHGDATGALALTQQHARVYPQGVLAQEREVIAIEALLALKRRDEAKARGAAFRAAYPGSGHIARLDAMLGAP